MIVYVTKNAKKGKIYAVDTDTSKNFVLDKNLKDNTPGTLYENRASGLRYKLNSDEWDATMEEAKVKAATLIKKEIEKLNHLIALKQKRIAILEKKKVKIVLEKIISDM